MIDAGHDDLTIAAVVLDPAHGISANPRELGQGWLARELARARAKGDVEIKRPMGPTITTVQVRVG